jgi:hypothetical protein
MARPIDSTISDEPNRIAIRLLFVGFLLCALVLVVVRECFGEPYPGPFMPAFKGTGLQMESPTEASIILPKMIITFSDQTTAEISQPSLFGYATDSIHRSILFMIVPDPQVEAEEGIKQKFRTWLSKVFPTYRVSKTLASVTVQDDVRKYLHQRLTKLYPSKTPVSLTIYLYKNTFPLADFHKMTSQFISQSTISFHEGA